MLLYWMTTKENIMLWNTLATTKLPGPNYITPVRFGIIKNMLSGTVMRI